MDGQHIVEVVRKNLRTMMDDGADNVALGGAKDWGEYQRLVGRLEGLAIAEREILDAAQKLMASEES
jgi:hypothetical protein|tara:strand:+ start:8484 stop:8684 length:201 start_codon:yes stop_codon:yes gene_type:complete